MTALDALPPARSGPDGPRFTFEDPDSPTPGIVTSGDPASGSPASDGLTPGGAAADLAAYDSSVLAKDRVEELAGRLGLQLPDVQQWDFLQATTSLDLQAAPGSGKTTLVALKLALLAGGWRAPQRGVCVLSHTNTAKDEIRARLESVPAGRPLLAYPHFIGTIQTFVDTFLALPALRSQGITVRSIDDDAYAAAAVRLLRASRFRQLAAYLGRRQDGRQAIETAQWVYREGGLVATLPDKELWFGATTVSGRQFTALKRELTRQGVFRYGDLYAIALHHIKQTPQLTAALSHRFPFVLIDEMQDTSDLQQHLLQTTITNGTGVSTGSSAGVVVQRVGDVNQRIFVAQTASGSPSTAASSSTARPPDTAAGTEAATHSYAFPCPTASELPVSRRFGPAIAALASQLTLHRPQRIQGAGPQAPIVLMLFDERTVQRVVPAFEELAARIVPAQVLRHNPPHILGSRLRRKGSSVFPQSLACYLSGGQPVTPVEDDIGLIAAARSAQAQWLQGQHHAAADTLWEAIRRLADLLVPHTTGTPTADQATGQGTFQAMGAGRAALVRQTQQGLPPLRWLDRSAETPQGRARVLMHRMLTSTLTDPAEWSALTGELCQLLTRMLQPLAPTTHAAASVGASTSGPPSVLAEELEFVPPPVQSLPPAPRPPAAQTTASNTDALDDARNDARRGGDAPVVSAVPRSIQSAKGQTHSATLIVDCLEHTGKKHDVSQVLSLIADGGGRAGQAPAYIRKAAQLIFVGVTRPTHLLVLAADLTRVRPHLPALRSREGWQIQNLTGQSLEQGTLDIS
ncbi:UvrD-helicase domain-containing protein [Spirillospora sp. NBC_01491]|uniref:UvrD-helicase domain-containing protein n=1 Tax=Spirillospora sp. NBC_01491 TaxID=2976007 RepID=UPI002E30F0E9|nr:UvrD-helicase domain-containing protein [Spirillospora sp. NBC_01491]